MTMSTYKSLGGPAGGLVVTNDAGIAERLDTIAYPGLTANFDAAKSAALAMTMLDWKEQGAAYRGRWSTCPSRSPAPCTATASRSSGTTRRRPSRTSSRCGPTGGAEATRPACGCGGPTCSPVRSAFRTSRSRASPNGLRIGTPELARIGMQVSDMPRLAGLVRRGLDGSVGGDLERVGREVSAWRREFTGVHFTAGV